MKHRSGMLDLADYVEDWVLLGTQGTGYSVGLAWRGEQGWGVVEVW